MTLQEYNDIFKNPVMKQMRIISSGGVTITNSNIVSESMSLEQSLCSEDNLRYGRCEASCFRIRIADLNHDFTGEWLDVWMDVVTNGDGFLLLQNGSLLLTQDGQPLKLSDEEIMELSVEIGRFKVYSDKPSNDRRWRDLICYDRMYDILNADVTSWYNGLTFPMQIIALRNSFFNYLGITQTNTAICINDYFTCYGGFETDTFISGKMIIEAICEFFGCFGHINSDDEFQYMRPGTGSILELDYYQDGTGSYEDYTTELITGIKAIGSDGDVGTFVGTTNNVYVIENNPLIYGSEGTQALTTALNKILDKIHSCEYRPFSVTTYGNPMLPLGCNLKITTKNQVINSYVINKTMTGIQNLKDTYSALGEKKQPSVVNAVSASIKRTKGKVHDLRIDVDELSSEITTIDNSLDRVAKGNVAMYECTNYSDYTISSGGTSVTHKCIVLNLSEDDFLKDLFTLQKASIGVVFRLALPAQTEQIYLRLHFPVSRDIFIPIYFCINNTTSQFYNQVEIKTNSILYFQLMVTEQNLAEAQLITNAVTSSLIKQSEDSILLSVSGTYVTQTSYDAEIQNLQNQIDGYVEYWYGDWVPTLNNYPASDWDTEAKKNLHLGDLFAYEHTVYHQGTAEDVTDYYRFEKDTRVTPNTYGWNLLGANDVDEALRQANEANRKAEAAQQQLNTLQSNVENNYSTTQQMNSAINLSAQNIVSTVSYSQDKYDTSNLGYSINFYGYGAPSDTQYPPADNNGNHYLNNNNGQVYYCNGSMWSATGSPLQKITTKQQTQIDQNAGQIVLKANNQGQIVQVALSASASTGSEFKVHADNIELTSGNKLVLSSNVFEINTEYFTYTPSNGLQIIDGSINIHNSNNDRYFKVNSNGTIEVALTNLSISNTGKLSCSDIDISGGAIYIHNSGSTRYFKVNSSGTIDVKLDNLTIGTTGKLTCSDIEISGGSIDLHNSGNTRYFKANADGTIEVALANLSISDTGKLTCSDIDISGGSINLHNSGNTRYFKANANGTIDVKLDNLIIDTSGNISANKLSVGASIGEDTSLSIKYGNRLMGIWGGYYSDSQYRTSEADLIDLYDCSFSANSYISGAFRGTSYTVDQYCKIDGKGIDLYLLEDERGNAAHLKIGGVIMQDPTGMSTDSIDIINDSGWGFGKDSLRDTLGLMKIKTKSITHTRSVASGSYTDNISSSELAISGYKCIGVLQYASAIGFYISSMLVDSTNNTASIVWMNTTSLTIPAPLRYTFLYVKSEIVDMI